MTISVTNFRKKTKADKNRYWRRHKYLVQIQFSNKPNEGWDDLHRLENKLMKLNFPHKKSRLVTSGTLSMMFGFRSKKDAEFFILMADGMK